MRQSEEADWLEKLRRPQRIDALQPVAIRLILSLRLIALHRQAQRDPVPELTTRLGSVTVAIAAMELVETLTRIWPEPIQVSRMCCPCLTHDEATLSTAIQSAGSRERAEFDRQFEGFLRPGRIEALWEQAVCLVAAEYAAG